MSKQTNLAAFRLRGQFLGFAAPGAKSMRLATPNGECTIKLAKALRPSLNRTLTLGSWIEVSGYQKPDSDSGGMKLKAERILTLAPSQAAHAAPVQAASAVQSSRKTEILVCQKSDCCKLGGKALMRQLQTELQERGLNDVQIKGTGCMKRCKAGPNLVMPDKSRYSRIQAEDVSALLDQKFPGSCPESDEIAS